MKQSVFAFLILVCGVQLGYGKPQIDTVEINRDLAKAVVLSNSDPVMSDSIVKQVMDKLGSEYPRIRLNASMIRAKSLFNLGKMDEAMAMAEICQRSAEELDDPATRLDAIKIKMAVWLGQGAIDEVKKAAQTGLEVAERLDLKSQMIDMNNALGNVGILTGNYDQGIENFLRALRAADEVDSIRQQGLISSNLASAYLAVGDIAKAKQYNDRALLVAQKTNNMQLLAAQYIMQANIFDYEGKLLDQTAALEKGLQIARRSNIKQVESYALTNLADLYLMQHKYQKALDYAADAEKLADEMNDLGQKMVLQVTRAQALGKIGKTADAIAIMKQALQNFQSMDRHFEATQVKGYLSEVYEDAGRWREALGIFKEFKADNDKLMAEEKQKTVAELQEKYEADKKERVIALLAQDNKLKTAELGRRNAQRYIFIMAVFSLVVIAGLAFQRYRLSRRTNQQLNEMNLKLHEMSLTDSLTGLHNRRYFQLRIDQDMAYIRRKNHTDTGYLGFFIADIDFFKKVNDVEGHIFGDEVLKEFSKRLKLTIRDSDTLVRWGGEEFLFMTQDTNLFGAGQLAQRILDIIRSNPFEIDGKLISLTCSVGYCLFPFAGPESDGCGWEGSISIADFALYEAKRRGRNLAVLAVPQQTDLPAQQIKDALNDLSSAVANGTIILK